MRIIYLSNFLTHHQKPLSDEMFKLLGEGNYVFVNTQEVSEERKKMGWPVLEAPYLKHYKESKSEVDAMVRDFDVVIYGHAPLSLIKERYKSGRLVLCNTERRYKSLSRYLKYPINTYKSLYINKGYFLASSAFAPKDYRLSGMSLDKCFKWGYFPEVKTYADIDALITAKRSRAEITSEVSILWAGRLIGLKHPEVTLALAEMLKKDNYQFHINIIGNGILENSLKAKMEDFGLKECVNFLGGMTPSEVREHMGRRTVSRWRAYRNCRGRSTVRKDSNRRW